MKWVTSSGAPQQKRDTLGERSNDLRGGYELSLITRTECQTLLRIYVKVVHLPT